MKNFILVLTVLCFQFNLIAQEDRPIGANLTDLSPFGTLWIYTNALKQSSGWLPRNANGENDPINGSSELRAELSEAFDENGYPLEVPFQFDHPETQDKTLEVSCLVLNGQQDPYLYPSGNYLLVFEGEGSIQVQGDVDGEFMEFTMAGEHTIPISNPSFVGLELIIASSIASNPIRNVQLIFPDYISNYETVKFNQSFIDLTEELGVLRFMKPLRVEHNTVENWEDRTLSSSFSYYLDVEDQILLGMPYEEIIEFSNLANVDPWICVPHQATDDYITNLANLFNSGLEDERTLYLEYSNETWNPSYPQKWQYMLDQGNARNLGTHENQEVAELQAIHRFSTLRSIQMFEIFNGAFDNDDQVVKILGTQSDPFIADLVFEALELPEVNPNSTMPDAVAIASYVGVTMFDDFAEQNLEVCNHTAQELLDTLMNRVVPELTEFLDRYDELTTEAGIDLYAYEGGHHVTEINFQPMSECAENLVAEMNRLPGMEDFFCQLFDTWYESLDGELFMIFNLAERPDPFGAFGLLESQWQSTSQSSKWRSLENCIWNEHEPLNVWNDQRISIYPNPTSGHITFNVDFDRVEILDLSGRELHVASSIASRSLDLNALNLEKGIYLLKVDTGGGTKTFRVILD